MKNEDKTKNHLIKELKQSIAKLEAADKNQKMSDKALKENEEKYRSLVEITSDWIWEVDQNGIYIYVSPKVKDLLGYEPDEVIGKTPFDFMTSEEAERITELFWSITESKKSFAGLENINIHKNGQHVILETSGVPIFDVSNKYIGYRGIDRDITERKKMEEEKRTLEQQIGFILGATKTGLDIIDSDFNIRYIDPEWEKIYNIGAVGKKCYKYFMDRDEPCLDCGIPKAMKSKKPVVTEEYLLKENRPIQVTTIPLQNKEGEWLFAEVKVDITERTKAEEALRKSEEKFRTFMETATDLMHMTDKDINFTYINEAVTKTLGYSKEEMVGMHVSKVLSKEMLEKFDTRSEEIIEKGKATFEDTWITKDGQEIYGENNVIAVYDDDGKFAGVRATFRDITDRRKSEEALKESEEKLRTFMESASDLMHIMDKDGNFIYVNEAMANTLGYTKEEMIGMHLTKILHKEHSIKFGSKREELLKKGKLTFEGIWLTKDGKEINGELKIVPTYDSDGRHTGSSGVFRDITERKNAEDALKESEEKFRTFMETASDFMYMTDKDGNLIFVNESMTRSLGYSKEELIGIHIAQVINKESLGNDIIAKVRKEVTEKGKLTFEDIWITKNGKELNGENKIVAIYDSDGKLSGSRGVFRDITERKQMEQELEHRASSLEEVNAALRVLLKTREEDKTDLEEKVFLNLQELVLPYLEKLKKNRLNKEENIYVNILESNLKDIISPFVRTMSLKYLNLSPKEIQVANLIKKDKNSKEIGALLNLAKKTIDTYRDSIRKKIGIKHKKVNLKTYLLSIK
jgi:PAS domain S-box-containing protein